MYIEWTPTAQTHLQRIIDHYTSINPEVGLNIFNKIRNKANYLQTFPRMGRAGLSKDTFELPVKSSPPYFLVYELLPDKNDPEIISIMGIFSGRQKR